jgi:HD-GYP domain-containing protein (c-di-GMP phosphodiesterase class II)
LLKDFKPFTPMANLIRFHHVPWKGGQGVIQDGEPVPRESHLIHLADRIAVKISKEKGVLGQVSEICRAIIESGDDMFVPEYVDAMLSLSKRDYIWLEVTSDSIEHILRREILTQINELDTEELLDFSKLISRLIDFKSEFTATHSSGVAATATTLAKLVGFSEAEGKLMKTAAYLHDLGKLAIPSEIIEKPAKLTDEEWSIMRAHVYYTYQILEPLDIFGLLNSWSSLHQERVNGTGYPFGYKGEELPLGSRIMAVADVFTALTEDRPYRKGMDKKNTMAVLKSMVDDVELDERLVSVAIENFEEMNQIRDSAQQEAISGYLEFKASLLHGIDPT